MKGLLKKEFYTVGQYFKTSAFSLPLLILFLVVTEDIPILQVLLFMFLYPLPVYLVRSDRKSQWDRYCCTLPCTCRQIVSAKYLVCLLMQLLATGLMVVVTLIWAHYSDDVVLKDALLVIQLLVPLALLLTSYLMPFLFWAGLDDKKSKRICNLFTNLLPIMCLCTLVAFLNDLHTDCIWAGTPVVAFAAVLVVYPLSWYLSIRLCTKRPRNRKQA